ncbi:hypothetical protein KA977_12805 [Candidatus Dependentiae bacterium]|nr:hypothetical protein [Candidatus Dependentiae bacterium]
MENFEKEIKHYAKIGWGIIIVIFVIVGSLFLYPILMNSYISYLRTNGNNDNEVTVKKGKVECIYSTTIIPPDYDLRIKINKFEKKNWIWKKLDLKQVDNLKLNDLSNIKETYYISAKNSKKGLYLITTYFVKYNDRENEKIYKSQYLPPKKISEEASILLYTEDRTLTGKYKIDFTVFVDRILSDYERSIATDRQMNDRWSANRLDGGVTFDLGPLDDAYKSSDISKIIIIN